MTTKALLDTILNEDKLLNQQCADCNKFLLDMDDIYASFMPRLYLSDQNSSITKNNWIETKYGKNFIEMHQNFAPNRCIPSTDRGSIRRLLLSEHKSTCARDLYAIQSIAHCVFVCGICAEIHSRLQPSTTKVKLLSDFKSWSDEECRWIMNKGNARGNNLLEKFIPEMWIQRKGEQFQNKVDRQAFIRYKYEALEFIFPSIPSQYSHLMRKNKRATKKWEQIAEKKDTMQSLDIDDAVYILGFRDYKLMKKGPSKKKMIVPYPTVLEAIKLVEYARQKKIRLISSCIKIQSIIRHRHLRRTFLAQKAASIKIQAFYRGNRARVMYALNRRPIVKIQSILRGSLLRSRLTEELKSRSMEYRQQILKLWDTTHTPLAYRTKFWLFIAAPGFKSFVLQEKELLRLWDYLELDLTNIVTQQKKSDHVISIVSTEVYDKYIHVKTSLQELQSGFLTMQKSDVYKCNNVYYTKRLQLERVQVYERMLKSDKLDEIYSSAGMSRYGKYKKVTVAKSIWSCTSSDGQFDSMKPEISAYIFSALFPELRHSSNINAVMPSRKGLDRLGVDVKVTVSIPMPLEGMLHFDNHLNQILLHDLKDMSRSLVSKISK